MRSIQVKRRFHNRQKALAMCALFLLAIVAMFLGVCLLQMAHNPNGLKVLAGSGLLLGVAAPLTEEKFRETVLGGIEKVTDDQKKTVEHYTELSGKFDNFDKDTKKAFEDLKKAANDSHLVATRALARCDALMKREARMAINDPIKRISADDEMRMNLNAVVRMQAQDVFTGYKMPEKFKEHIKNHAELEKRAVGEDTTPGSTYIMTELLREIYDTLARYGKWNTLGVRRMGTKLTRLPIKTARPIAQWITSEAGVISDDTNTAGTEVTLQVYPNAVLLNVSRQVIDDAEFDVTGIVMDDFLEAFNFRLDYTAFQGAGTNDGNNGSMTGLFNFGTATVAAAGNTGATLLQLEDFERVLLAVDPVVLERDAKWWMHPQMLVRLLSVRDLNGRPLFLNALEAPTPAGIGSILGYPVILAQACPSTNAAGKPVAAFGDPNSFLVGMREDFAFEATDAYRWNTYERSFRGVGRAGVKGRIATGSAILALAAQ